MSNCSTETGNFTDYRKAQIDHYDSQRYEFLTAAMKRYSYVLGFMIFLLILRNAGILPEFIFGWLFVPILAYLLIDMLYTFYSYKSRSPINFDTYIWTFNRNYAGSIITPYGSTDGSQLNVRCTNSACCGDGMSWNATLGKCAIAQQ
jgi:hypothetical protein